MEYLRLNPELKIPLPQFRLSDKTLQFTEGQQIISYDNIPNGYEIMLQSLRSMIDGDGVYVAWTLLENYYALLRDNFHTDDSSVAIPYLNSVECIYQVSAIFQELPSTNRIVSHKLLPNMLRYLEVQKIQPSLRTTKMMVFPFYYVPDKQFLLAVVQPGIHRIHFLDTLYNSN